MEVSHSLRDTLAGPAYAPFDEVLGDLPDGAVPNPPASLRGESPTVSLDLVRVRVQLTRRAAQSLRVDSKAATRAYESAASTP